MIKYIIMSMLVGLMIGFFGGGWIILSVEDDNRTNYNQRLRRTVRRWYNKGLEDLFLALHGNNWITIEQLDKIQEIVLELRKDEEDGNN